MNNDHFYWLKEAYRHLELALIAASGKSYEHIDKAIECLNKLKKEIK